MSDECGKCKAKLKRNDPHQRCSGLCHKLFHLHCAGFKPEEGNVVSRVKGTKWFCEICEAQFDVLMKMSEEIESFKIMVAKQLNEFKSILNSGKDFKSNELFVPNKSYADVASEILVIRPKANQDSSKTKEAIRKVMNPLELQVGITQFKDVKDGGVLIKCKTKTELDKIKNSVDKKLKAKYDIKSPEKKNPRIKIVDIEENLQNEELEEIITKQNMFMQHEGSLFKVVVVKKMKSRYMCIAECDPTTFKNIMSNKDQRLFVNFSYCRVFEHFSLFRCYKCGVYDHKAEECQNVSTCLICMKTDHVTKDCTRETTCCVNCTKSNNELKTTFNTSHSLFDHCCPIYIRKIQNQKTKIKTSE